MYQIADNGCFQADSELTIGIQFYIQCPFPPFHSIEWSVTKIGRKYIYARNLNNVEISLTPLGGGWYKTNLPFSI